MCDSNRHSPRLGAINQGLFPTHAACPLKVSGLLAILANTADTGTLSFTVGEHKSALVGLSRATECFSQTETRDTSAQLIGQNESHGPKPPQGPGSAIADGKDNAHPLVQEGTLRAAAGARRMGHAGCEGRGTQDARGVASFCVFNPHAPGCEIGL